MKKTFLISLITSIVNLTFGQNQTIELLTPRWEVNQLHLSVGYHEDVFYADMEGFEEPLQVDKSSCKV